MKKISAILTALLMLAALFTLGAAAADDPVITAINVLDEDEQLIEIVFSEPVNCHNLGYIIPVETYPNGDRAWANLEWNGEYHYYGCVDKTGNAIGDEDQHIVCDSDNDYIYATSMVVTIGAIQNGGLFEDISGIEFKEIENKETGAFTTPDGRTIKASDPATGSLFVKLTREGEDETEAPATEETTSSETNAPETKSPETNAPETKPKETEKAPADGTSASSDSMTNAPAAESGSNTGLYIAIAAAVAVVIAAIVVFIIVKNKKSK